MFSTENLTFGLIKLSKKCLEPFKVIDIYHSVNLSSLLLFRLSDLSSFISI